MIDSIILGCKDIFRNRRIYFATLFMILATCIIVMASTLSVLDELNLRNRGNSQLFRTTVISTNMNNNVQLVDDLYRFYQSHGGSYFLSTELMNLTEYETRILVGAQYEELLINGRTTVYSSSDIYESMKEKDVLSEFQHHVFDREKFDIDEINYAAKLNIPMVVIVFNEKSLSDWVQTEDGSEIISLVDNSQFSKEDKKNGVNERFIELFETSFLKVQEVEKGGQLDFILKYIYAIAFLMILVTCLSMYILYSIELKKLYKEYTIHLIHGATLMDIFVRSSIFIVSIIAVCIISILYLVRFKMGTSLTIGLITLTLLLIIFELIILTLLKRKNLLKNLKGDL